MIFYCLILFNLIQIITSNLLAPDNICTFHINGSVFSLVFLQHEQPYMVEDQTNNNMILFNFCVPFKPPMCPNATPAFSFIVRQKYQFDPQITKQQDDTVKSFSNKTENENPLSLRQHHLLEQRLDNQNISYECIRYSSNSYSQLFKVQSYQIQTFPVIPILKLTKYTQNIQSHTLPNRYTQIHIQCSQNTDFTILSFNSSEQHIKIYGHSKYGCPIFTISSLWKVFDDNGIIFGIILSLIGFYLLFYGRQTINITVFIATFFIIFAILCSIATTVISPYSQTYVIYFSFVFILFMSTLISYGITKAVDLSIFFIGAFFGFVLGMLINSLFCQVTEIYTIWSFVFFVFILSLPLGFLTFTHKDDVIVASSSLTGAYLIVRPISWIIGGFPNEFLLYHSIQALQMPNISLLFILYLILIIMLALIGSMYQNLKIQRKKRNQQIQTNIIQKTIQEPIDKIKQNVQKLIEKYKISTISEQSYQRMSQLEERR